MKKRVFIVHGWDSSPQGDWFPWLKKELENKNFEVIVPTMPHPEKPTIEDWVNCLIKLVGKPNEQTYFVGHSVGCQTILRYLEGLPSGKKIGGVVLVAGFFATLKGLTSGEKEIIKPWLETPINSIKIKQHADNFVAIFSDNDPFIPLKNKEIFEKELGAKTIIEHAKGHFTDGNGITKLPIALKSILEIAG